MVDSRPPLGIGHVLLESDRYEDTAAFVRAIGMRPVFESSACRRHRSRRGRLSTMRCSPFETGRYLGSSLEVPGIDAFYRKLSAVVSFTGPPEPQVWGGIMTHVNDVSGNTFSIVQILD